MGLGRSGHYDRVDTDGIAPHKYRILLLSSSKIHKSQTDTDYNHVFFERDGPCPL